MRTKLNIEKVKEIVRLGIPSALTSVLMSLSFTLFNILGAPYGDSFIAAMGLSLRIVSMPIMILIGLTSGYQPIAGYSYGAGNLKRLESVTYLTFVVSTLVSSVSYLGLKIFNRGIISLFSDVTSIQTECVSIIDALIKFLPLMGIVITAITLFVALGKSKESLILALTRQGIILIPSMYILPMFFGKLGLIYAQPIADLASFIVCVILLVKLAFSIRKDELVNKKIA